MEEKRDKMSRLVFGDLSYVFLIYRELNVSHLLENLGWVDFDLGSSPGLLEE